MTGDQTAADPLAGGWAALGRGDWEGATGCFEAAVAREETPEAFEGLGWAGYCSNEERLTLDARERAFHLYRDRGDDSSAGRVAALLAVDFLEFRGEAAVAKGWLQRAHRLLDDLAPGGDHGWLAIHEASIILDEDTGTARRLAARAVGLGREFGVPELEMVGLGIEGRALVSEGEVEEGMRRLDEATAVALAGETRILMCSAWACCYMIAACDQVRDYERARQWCERVGDFCERYGIGLLLGLCRAKYAGVLTWQGRWADAESELMSATEGLSTRPPLVGDALVRLAELRRRQGRLEEAEQLFARCEGHPRATLGHAALALDRGEPEEAAALADRFLRRFPDPGRMERCAGLEIAVRAHARLDDLDRAHEALDQLREIASHAGTRPLRAAVLASEGTVAAARGDQDTARRAFEDALDLFAATGAPYDAAQARLDLATTLGALGHDEVARRESEAALATFQELGAAGAAVRAEALLDRLRRAGQVLPTGSAEGRLSELSRRELEVLALVAQGLTNQEIAGRLVISEHTVNRHVANILRKLGVPSRAGAASLAGRHGLG
jgi:LuxR family maltose regulon positive regulatory protein